MDLYYKIHNQWICVPELTKCGPELLCKTYETCKVTPGLVDEGRQCASATPNALPSQAEKPDCSNEEDDDHDYCKDMTAPGCSHPNDDSEFNKWDRKPPCSMCGPESLNLCCEIDESCEYSAGLGSDGWSCAPVAPNPSSTKTEKSRTE